MVLLLCTLCVSGGLCGGSRRCTLTLLQLAGRQELADAQEEED